MATLALGAIGAAVGGALLPGGLAVLGATLSGAAIGAQVGALAGRFVDQALFGASGQARALQGPRLSDLHVTGAAEGAPIPRVYGRARLGGQVIWATKFEEETVTGSQGGGKGGGGGGTSTTTTSYRYTLNFAVAICEGPVTRIGRVWADGKELDLSQVTYRLHTGTQDQQPDSLIVAKEGAGNAPAYRGTAYIVFERMPLARFGNRMPQLSFEAVRAVDPFEREIRAVTLIPGAGEFVYDTIEVTRSLGLGAVASENVHTKQGGADWSVALTAMQAELPNVRHVSLYVSWFGTDLRAGLCQMVPGVEIAGKDTSPTVWSVAGQARQGAHVVSQKDGKPAFGGTPADACVMRAIADLKARGLSVTLSPFMLIDVAAGNGLGDPHTGAASQPVYPWRGRITIDPAPGRSGSPDQTTGAAAQIAAFVGSASVGDYAILDSAVSYTGPTEWSYRRMILHYAYLAKAAGGVDAFLIGSEMRGLTTVRGTAGGYPFVAALVQLAADVKTILGAGTLVTYGADWSEYFGHQPSPATGAANGDLTFHLDPLWASANIDAVGIDCYWPLADWRTGSAHLDWQAGARAITDLNYLKSNIFGAEGYDWYYASAADRDAQVRTPITDGGGKPWVYRFKDIRAWWGNPHYNRVGGAEQASATAWTPQSKPIWFTELGCPAVDKGANQPNVFHDPKSSESAFPYFSSGARDDFMQRRYLQAMHEFFDATHAGYAPGSNPISPVYGAPMLALDRIYVYTWDARPYPAFPNNTAAWGDGPNWTHGHWLNGRIASAPVAQTVAAILDDYGFADYDVSTLRGVIGGAVIDRIMAPREALQPLELSQFIDSVESAGKIRFRPRGLNGPVVTLAPGDLVETAPEAARFQLTRGQETELPAAAKIGYVAAGTSYHGAIAEARRSGVGSQRIASADLALVLDEAQAEAIAQSWLFEAWAARERATFALPPSRLALEPGDLVTLSVDGRERLLRLIEVADGGRREVHALGLDPGAYDVIDAPTRAARAATVAVYGKPLFAFLDLPLLRGDEIAHAGYVAAYQSPWPGSIAVYRSPGADGFLLNTQLAARATMGETRSGLASGPTGCWDMANAVTVELAYGQLLSVTDLALFDGANLAAIETAGGQWELIQFGRAELTGDKTYRLSRLLRGQAGTEASMGNPVPPGARFVLIDQAVRQVAMSAGDVGRPFNWKIGPANRDLAAASFASATLSFEGVGLRPLSPVHVRGERSGGDVTVGWVRRTRSGGDSWALAEVPLAEDAERYEVDILDGAAVKRTLAVSTPAAVYSQAQQLADWGAAQAQYSVRVCQLSQTYGRGAATLVTV